MPRRRYLLQSLPILVLPHIQYLSACHFPLPMNRNCRCVKISACRKYEYIMGKPEQERLGSFYDLWVLKESYMKATGLGFRLALDDFCIHMSEGITVERNGQIQQYSFFLTQLEGYKLAVCYQCKINCLKRSK